MIPAKPDHKHIKIDFMRTDNNNLLASLSNDHINNLVKEVKETVATDATLENSKTFSAADLWRIQKNTRMRVQRRLIF
jgi:hypothetical protein